MTVNPIAPEVQMQALLGGYRTTQMLFVVAKLGLADLLASGRADIESGNDDVETVRLEAGDERAEFRDHALERCHP